MMETPITINELNKIDSVTNEVEFKKKTEEKTLNDCILEINTLLKRYWHRVSYKSHLIPGKFNYGYGAFNKAKVMFSKNGIDLSYYQPHGILSIKITEND